MDKIDFEILAILRRKGRISKAELGRRVGLTSAAVIERMRKLESSGAIRGYRADIDPQVLGFGILAYVFVRDNDPSRRVETGERLAALTGVEEVVKVTGEDTFLVKLRTKDTLALARLLEGDLGGIETVASTRTCLALETVLDGDHP